MMRLAICCAVVVAIAGCAAGAPQPAQPQPPPAEAVAPLSAEEQTLAAMLERARTARLAGMLSEAEELLESALRIAPGDARLWLELAETQFASGEFDAASNLAERAVALSGGDESIVEAARRLSMQAAQ